MNREAINNAARTISAAKAKLEEAKGEYKDLVAATLEEVGDSQDLTPSQLKALKKVAEAMAESQGKVDAVRDDADNIVEILEAIA